MRKTTFWKNNSENISEKNSSLRNGNMPTRRRVAINKTRSEFLANIQKKPLFAAKKSNNYGHILTSVKNFLLSGVFLRRLFGGFLILTIIGMLIIWGLFLQDVPDIRKIDDASYLKESTVFYDAYGNEFYRYGENGKRTNVEYDEISQSIKDAIVSAEDQNFFENPGFDVLGLARAGFNYVTGRSNQIKGTSTISQQLIKNTLLTNERSLKRKIQEAYLAYQLNKNYTKEQILTKYLNRIEFGHGAHGVEEASRTFFGKSAKDVGPLGATILASLPKSPTKYSPYSKRENLMGKIEAYPSNQPNNKVLLDLNVANGQYAPLYNDFKAYIKGLNFKPKGNNSIDVCGLKQEFTKDIVYAPDKNGCKNVDYEGLVNILGNITVKGNLAIDGNPAEPYTIEYTVGRKDYVASQMLRFQKIPPEVFANIFYDGLEFQFHTATSTLKYPYFIMYVQEQLEQKYGDDINIKSGLKVYTTLRPNLQEKAESLVVEQVKENMSKGLGATSASLVAMDNTTGEIIAMVGGPNYEKDKNNMTTALRQPGSSFKPLIYALAISKWPIGPESPIADVRTEFNRYKPNNYDLKFNGIMTLGKALAYSRNIPAVKMFFLAGMEKEIIPFVKKLGISSLRSDGTYQAPLALGTGEVKAIEMMQAYSVFANNGFKREAYAIKRIEDAQGGIIEEKGNNQGQQVFSAPASYIISKILSENKYRPESDIWRNNLTVNGKTAAAKTGTSNWESKTSNKILPRDTWTVGYTPNITTAVWAGNVDGTPLWSKCDGINCAAPAWKKFMEFAHKDLPNVPFKEPSDLLKYKTAKLSGLLSDNGVENIMAVPLDERDTGNREVRIDYCGGGAVTSKTPADAIVIGYTTASKPIIDRFEKDWLTGFYSAANISAGSSANYDPKCNRAAGDGPWSVNISSQIVGAGNNVLEVSWSGDRAIRKFRVTLDGKVLKETTYDDAGKTGQDRISTSEISTANSVVVELIDVYGFKYTKSGITAPANQPQNPTNDANANPLLPSLTPPLPSISEDNSIIEPTISITYPTRSSINLYKGEKFNLRFTISPENVKRTTSIIVDGITLKTEVSEETNFAIPIITSEMSLGNHNVTLVTKNANGKTNSKSFTLTILEK